MYINNIFNLHYMFYSLFRGSLYVCVCIYITYIALIKFLAILYFSVHSEGILCLNDHK